MARPGGISKHWEDILPPVLLLFAQILDVSFCQVARDADSVVTFHEATARFWPAADPNRFGIASNSESNSQNNAGKSEERFARNPTSSFKTKDGRSVAVFDGVLEYRTQMVLQDYVHLAGTWRFHGYSGTNHDKNSRRSSGVPWTASFDSKTFANSEIGRRIHSLVTSLAQAGGDDDNNFEPYKVVCNILRRGDIIYPHREVQDKKSEFTALLYLNQLWRKNDYGELLFLDEGDMFATIGPKFNRVVIWDASIEHLTRPPSMAFKQSQFFLTIHYSRNHTKTLQQERAKMEIAEQQRQAEANLFATMTKPVEENLEIGNHVTMKYRAKNGKKVFVFDDLFSWEDLDKLRRFTVNHGTYYFDDSIDSDSDNVQWIAAFNIDDFVQSSMWNVTKQVAKYVSGTDKWFPYDIACNIIRAYDHTRIHEDCERQEDEWTFLLYLTPNWTEDYYGETVFRENNRDDSEYVASVVPHYGRVAIFQGIIPHSARPPSTLFTGARLSFAVKLSVNPWVARVKMMKQEFAHEESMHQSVLSILKYYNDASFEARYKKQLIRTAEDVMEVEQEQRMRYLEDLKELHLLGEDGDGEQEDDDEDEDDSEEGEEFDFEENNEWEDENEFPEISLRKDYIYNLIKTLKPDAEALARHYTQFLKDREVMTQRYIQEIAQLF